MAATQLGLYNGALRLLGEEQLVAGEEREASRVLDSIWSDGFIKRVLEQGFWNFAIRTIQVDAESSISPSFGYQYGYEYPSDYVRLVAISQDEYLNASLMNYRPEGGFFWCDYDQIYISYVSDATNYGGDLSLWPETFKRYAEHLLALDSCLRLTQDKSKYADLFKITERKLIDARSKDAVEQPVMFPPSGSWANARAQTGFGYRRRSGGNGAGLV